jgi:hypothetical protein
MNEKLRGDALEAQRILEPFGVTVLDVAREDVRRTELVAKSETGKSLSRSFIVVVELSRRAVQESAQAERAARDHAQSDRRVLAYSQHSTGPRLARKPRFEPIPRPVAEAVRSAVGGAAG